MTSEPVRDGAGGVDLAPAPGDERWERRPLPSLLVSVVRPLGVMAVVAFGVVRREAQDALAGEAVEIGFVVVLGAVALVVSIGLVGYQVLLWRRFRWSVTPDGLHTRHGGLSRVSTTYVASRIGGVDLREPLLERVLGLCTVRVEVSGSGASSAELVGVPRSRAEALQRELLALRDTPSPEGPDAADPATEERRDVEQRSLPGVEDDDGVLLLALDRDRARSWVLRSPGVWLAFGSVAGGLVTAAVLGARDGWGVALTLLVPTGAWLFGSMRVTLARWRSVATLRIRERPDGLVVTRGRLSRTRTSIRAGQIAAVQLRQGPIRRAGGWWEVSVSVAAFGSSLDREAGATVCAVATPGEVGDLLPRLLPDLDEASAAVVADAMAAPGPAPGWDRAQPAARWLAPLAWRSTGIVQQPQHLLTRNGRWRRTIRVLDRHRVQTVAVDDGPLVRRLGLAHLHVRLPPGPTRTTTIGYLDAGRAASLQRTMALDRGV